MVLKYPLARFCNLFQSSGNNQICQLTPLALPYSIDAGNENCEIVLFDFAR